MTKTTMKLLSSNAYAGMGQGQFFESYPTYYLRCRVYGHRWPEDDTDLVMWKYVGKGLLDRIYACTRCGAVKTEHLNTHHERVANSDILYPRGYLTPKTGLVKQDFRGTAYSEEFARASASGDVFK